MSQDRTSELRPPATRRATLATCLALALLASALYSPAPTRAGEPERSLTTPTSWWWYTGVSSAFLTNKINTLGARIIDIEVQGPNKFSAALVKNAGPHAKAWWWYFGISLQTVKNKLKKHKARILDLETYVAGGKRRYAVVLVPRGGTGWWWWVGVSPSFIASKLAKHGARLIDLETYVSGGTRRYAAVMVKKPGPAWWWYFNVTSAFVKSKLKQHKARLIDIERHSTGRYTVIMERNKNKAWWWWINGTKGKINQIAGQFGARIIDIERYRVGGKTRFAAIFLDNVAGLTAKVRNIMAKGTNKGTWGFYLKEVGGPVLATIFPDKVFEPASTIKALHHYEAMRKVDQEPGTTLTTQVTWYVHPNNPSDADDVGTDAYKTDRNICAYRNNGTLITSQPRMNELQRLAQLMMQQSDNRTTDGILRFVDGPAGDPFDVLNARAAALGMSKTDMNHRIGCQGQDILNNHNKLTLRDAGRLYESVATSGLGGAKQAFYDNMIYSTAAFRDIVEEEAAKQGKSAVVDSFLGDVERAVKGGSYDFCVTSCSEAPTLVYRSDAGWFQLPFKSVTGGTVIKQYVHGRFFDGAKVNCVVGKFGQCTEWDKFKNAWGKVTVELVRNRVAAALQTW